MIVAFSGHRPSKIGGYKIPNPTYDKIKSQIKEKLIELKPDCCISGMALGVDQYAAEVCIELNIPFIAAIPFEGQDSVWPKQNREKYRELLSKAKQIKIISEGAYLKEKMQIRNEWMVDNCDILVAVFNGSKGGTFNCVRYAKNKGKEIVVIDP